jgi:hypothetical protein
MTYYSMGQTYHVDDKEGLRAFLRQPAAITGEINAQQLGLQINDTLNWLTQEDWVSKVIGLMWNENTPKRLVTIGYSLDYEWQYKNLSGNLNCNYWSELTHLYCNYNQIKTIDAGNNVSLISLSCSNNLLTSINVTNCVALSTLACGYNQLTALHIINNLVLSFLICQENQLTTLDVSNNVALSALACGYNQLTNLDVSNNINLEGLQCEKNQLTTLDLENNTKISMLYCYSNQLTSLDLSNQSIEYLYCGDNRLTTLIVGSGIYHTLQCHLNYLLFSKIPQHSSSYNPQHMVDGGNIAYNDGIDLSNQYRVGENITHFLWFDITSGDEQTIEIAGENGLFLLTDAFIGKRLRCKMTNASFPELISVYEVKIVDKVGTETYDVAILLHLYPNPTTGELRIDGEKLRIESVEIYDITGSIVFSQKSVSTSFDQKLDIAHLNKGIYFVKIVTKQSEVIKKVMKL